MARTRRAPCSRPWGANLWRAGSMVPSCSGDRPRSPRPGWWRRWTFCLPTSRPSTFAIIVAPRPGQAMLEIGQGRGTKTVLMESAAIAAGGHARIVSVEVDAGKARVSRRRMERAGVASHTSTQVLDATLLSGRGLPAEIDTHFDVVFIDAPCSGTGTLRRHPEIAWSLEPEAVDPARDDSLPALQLRILLASASRVRLGGMLCYATCSLLAEEDEHVVEAFLASDAGMGFELADEPARLWLDGGRSDVHYLARMARVR